jgi:hypothetical protein
MTTCGMPSTGVQTTSGGQHERGRDCNHSVLDLGPCKTAQKRDREFLQNPHVCPFCDLLRAMDETVGTA